ncbi:DUF4157 domain-containing protein [Tenacibaculum larymnensis]|uniref:DUF4157 domain-containing protein n=1 Tax=Tenacibaculum larymnensis TaxID=2878201 RepID=A0A9X4EQ87_9FLAO|nr:DUF4157 domain-containing protein [Tenacibaculum larymnensis]MDE1206205.1 DUF4157 domain-containing protein [Tenacibaculum larymnensis]
MFKRDKKPEANNVQAKDKKKDLFIQPKLAFGKKEDQYEVEADNMADKVVGNKNEVNSIQKKENEEEIQQKPLASEVTPLVQKMETTEDEQPVQKMEEEEAVQSKEEEETVQSKCDDCEKEEQVQKQEEEEAVQSKTEKSTSTKNKPSFESKLKRGNGGQKMDAQTRSEMESGFGADFSRVNIHNNSEAAQMSQEIGAQAFTHGNDIYFNEGKYNPNSKDGKHLLAHELTHTIQQKGMVQKKIQRSISRSTPSCSSSSSVPLNYRGVSVRRGAYYTDVFDRPSGGTVNIFVEASSNDDNCHFDNTYGVNVWQCHILGDEKIESQHIRMFREEGGISYSITLPTEEWNTYEKFYLRLYFRCSATVNVSIT